MIKVAGLIEKAKLIFKSEPQRSFQKVGVTDAQDNLTEEGKDLLLNWLLTKNGDEFKKAVVDPILEEEKKEKKGE